MHGSFIVCLKEMMISKFDESFWLDTLELAGFDSSYRPVFNQELPDEKAIKLIKSTVKKLNMDDRRFGEMFGNYWIKSFARDKFFAFFDAYKTIKDFLNNLDLIHLKITANLKYPNPPRFEVNWENPSTAIIQYKSMRGFIHIAVGLLKAMADYYRQEISVYRVESDKIKIFIKN